MTGLLYESVDRLTMKRTRVVRDSETGLPLIITQQNTRPVLEDNKRMATRLDRQERRQLNRRGSGMMQVASIPFVVWQRLAAQGITKDRKRLLKWLSERDNRAFRTDDGRRLA
jgi:hypothetical protein